MKRSDEDEIRAAIIRLVTNYGRVGYEEQLRLQRQRLFGTSSEKTAYPEQIDLFNEVEDTADPKAAEPTVETITYF